MESSPILPSLNTYEIDEEENEENNDNYKNKNQNKNSSCELIILDDNNIFESVKKIKEENKNNEDNFDDINLIIKQIDLNENENIDKDILFS